MQAEEDEYEEDPNSDEGAVWPMDAGRVTNWSCFFALMEHIHRQISPPFHTPIFLVAQPVWTPREHEKITQFFFEKFKCPGFALVDSAVATCYAYGIETATIVDVGAEKADVTAVRDSLPSAIGRSASVTGCGGEAITERLLELLHTKGFSRPMCEQLKKSPICEILPSGTPIPGSQAAQNADGNTVNVNGTQDDHPMQAVSTGADGPGTDQRHTAGAAGQAPRGPGQGTEVGEEATVTPEEDEGVLDVASIVTGGKMTEYLAKKDQEKQAKLVAKKKGSISADTAAKPARLKNSEKEKTTFYYEDHALLDALKGTNASATSIAQSTAQLDEGPTDRQPTSATSTTSPTFPTSPSGPKSGGAPRRELTVGPERFHPASPSFLYTLTTAIHRTIQSHPDPTSRTDLWNNIIIVGNGSSVRGLKDAILETLNARFLVSPSSATIFTSELPSNFSTPLATGTNTPNPHGAHASSHALGHGGHVNPLLHAATTAAASGAGQAPPQLHQPHSVAQVRAQAQSHPHPHQPPQPHTPSAQPLPTTQHRHHAQSPTSIKLAKLPEYFLEWKEIGHEEAGFLGAQVAARCLFVVGGGGAEKGFLTRSEYNESGPQGIHEVVLGVGM